ncbi:Ms4527A family Cys-rich leader peptide [Mycobacterium sp. 852002-51613_SCH5001154]|uniref:Ms4527A family Cys-rich leader peptide n=1 Tax=Mycobacterium sp. 852002-51613_SCH5001154 TaxID=1834104 RepID=UPI003515F56D
MYTPNGRPGTGCSSGSSTVSSRSAMPNDPTVLAARPRRRSPARTRCPRRFPGFSHRRGQLNPNFAHRERIFDLVVWPPDGHGTMGNVTVAQPSLRIALVARRHIDLKRVCSCCCLP